MSSQSFGQTLASITAAGTLYNTYTTAKSILGSATTTAASAGIVQLPSGFFQIGTMLMIDFHLGVSWASGNTMTFSFNLGATGTTQVYTSQAIKVTTTGGTTEPVWGQVLLTCRSVGTGTLSTLMGVGYVEGRPICPPAATAAANYAAGMGSSMLSEAVPAVGGGFDSTIANTLDFLVAMGTSSASNGVQIQQYKVFCPNVAGF